MTDRLACLVPFCRRTHKPEAYSEWICGEHWRLVSKATRRRLFLARRRAVRLMGERGRAWAAFADRLWDRCKAEACERAVMA
jgi:hypothetical protein